MSIENTLHIDRGIKGMNKQINLYVLASILFFQLPSYLPTHYSSWVSRFAVYTHTQWIFNLSIFLACCHRALERQSINIQRKTGYVIHGIIHWRTLSLREKRISEIFFWSNNKNDNIVLLDLMLKWNVNAGVKMK